VLLITTVQSPTPAEAALARGDAYYAQRGQGSVDGICKPEPIEAAMAEYRRAMHLDPASYAARVGLMRAYFFRGGLCGMSDADSMPLFEEAKKVAEETVKRLEADRRRGRVNEEALVYLWAATSWGQWAVGHHLSAAWQKAPNRIRDMALAALELDPTVEQASGHTILGRLHTETPKIRLVTGWIDREVGLQHLRLAVALCPENPSARFFLADALLKLKRTSDAREEGMALLRDVASMPPRPEYQVEDGHYARQSRELLKHLETRVAPN